MPATMGAGNEKRKRRSPLTNANTNDMGGGLLRVRPNPKIKNINNNNTRKSQKIKDECFSAFVPILVIAIVWCFGCWIMAWATLYQSFSDSTNNSHAFSKREDILAIKLRQFLGDPIKSIGKSEQSQQNTILQQIINPEISNKIQSILVSELGFPQLLLGAFLEPPLLLRHDKSNSSSNENDNNENGNNMHGTSDDSFPRMELRTHTPQDLTYISYPYKIPQTTNATATNERKRPNHERRGTSKNQPIIGACSQKGAQWIFPTSHPPSLDHYFEGNVFRKESMFLKRWELALGLGDKNIDNTNAHDKGEEGRGHCPVDADPYLPWIHDAFPSNDGTKIEFIISNKRRCNTDPKSFQLDLQNLEPQVALMQPVPVKRWKEQDRAEKFAHAMGNMWTSDRKSTSNNSNKHSNHNVHNKFLRGDDTFNPPRYILATSLDDADEDGMYTRYICRFHTVVLAEEYGKSKSDGDDVGQQPQLKTVILGETLSNYPYNPEHLNYRKRGSNPMLTLLQKGHDEQIWNSVHQVTCPVPATNNTGNNHDIDLTNIIASGQSISRGIPSLYLDLIPIRTPVRRDKEGFGLPGVEETSFDPKEEWGDSHVLPLAEASGRWVNIPICYTPKVGERLVGDASTSKDHANSADPTRDLETQLPGEIETTEIMQHVSLQQPSMEDSKNKTHFLVGCVWASHSFSTRGQSNPTDSSTSDRLREFLTYHLKIAGFDHVYVYDNSDTTSSHDNTLSDVTDLFSPQLVTRIPWPHRICNNNRPAHSNPGERSSQYSAESSCRARYGPDTTWMSSLDVDEYLLPVGKLWVNLRHWLQHVTSNEKSTKILSFYQTRALPNIDAMIPYEGDSSGSCSNKSDGSISALLTKLYSGNNIDALKDTGIMNSKCAMKVRANIDMY